jgi:ABC-2 type transport system ATP-binding protein
MLGVRCWLFPFFHQSNAPRYENAMNAETPVIEIKNLTRRYGKLDAVNGLSLTVQAGKCYGFFGRNGAGKTTTIKCLLNLLRPNSGEARVFGFDPQRNEVAVKSRLAYVPDTVAFYPWMTVRGTLEYLASFRKHWNRDIEADLLKRFQLDPKQKASHLSKGQKTQLALIGAICPEPELLVLDEPTSGLDPIVRREFIETVIGAYQSGDPGSRTVFVSTHLIAEFEGLIDKFTIIEQGCELLTMEADAARDRFRKIRARFPQPPARLDLTAALKVKQNGREVEVLANGNSEALLEKLRALQPEDLRCESLSLEEIFVVSGVMKKATT